MNSGYPFLLLALLGYSMLGIFHKVADYKGCRARPITLLLFFWGGLLTSIYVFLQPSSGSLPPIVPVMALVAGTFASFAVLSFQAGLRYGKIATSWLLINLSMAVPAILSVVGYQETVTTAKALAVILIFSSMFLLWRDKRLDTEETSDADSRVASQSGKWLKLMLLAFLLNGLGAFGLRILVGEGAGDYTVQYLALMYWAGFSVMLLSSLGKREFPSRQEFSVSAIMGVASVTGTVGLATALDYGLPGFIAYPVSTGGGLVLVILAGILFFKEKLSRIGYLGIVVGISAVTILTLA